MKFEATLLVAPFGKQRPRFGGGRTYTPQETLNKEAEIRFLLRQEKAPKIAGAISLVMRCFFKKPKSCPKKRTRPTVKPDLDNVLKTVLDAGNGILYDDDVQVVQATVEKHYGDPERIEILLEGVV